MWITKNEVNGMVELSGVNIKHKSFGVGKVIEQTDTYLKIEFSVGIKQFQFPEAFEKFLQCEDSNTQNIVLEALEVKKEKEAEFKKQKQEEQARFIKTQTIVKPSGTRQKTYPKENIAFKCNYCNGGLAENGIGYICACTDEMIDYNIEVAQHNWCCDDDSPCKQYYDGLITRKELDSISEEDGFVCYESQMLRNWTAFAGFALTKENHQRPMKLNKVQVNSLAILTTREPHASEKDRFIFGVFLVDEAYEGDNRDEGYVTTSSKYKVSLTKEEAKKVLFWNYYHNENAPEKAAWGQGLHRYITDEQAASILKDIAAVKKGKKDEALAQEFLVRFCEINNIEISDLPIMEGALQRKSGITTSKKATTIMGFVNDNNQRNEGRLTELGTDHNQYFYQMKCLHCGHLYKANGSDIWQRKCPKCQEGKE